MAINWNEAPEWANCALTTADEWCGSKSNIGNIEFVLFDGEKYWADKHKDQEFTISNEWWKVYAVRPEEKPVTPKKSGSKYIITMRNKRGESIEVDAYDIITACNITCPAHAHAAKKVLYTGLRGHKDRSTDLRESIDALERAIELAQMEKPDEI
jgi:hypothetical protein